MFLPTDKFMVLGRSGCGKTTLGSRIVSVYPKVITFDSLHEYSEKDGVIVSGFSEFCDVLLRKQNKEKFHIIFQFDLESENNAAEFNEALRVAYYFGGVLLRIEEIQNFTSPHFIPKWLSHCLTTGRHRKIGMMFLTQMPRYCNKALISQAGHLFCGQLHERADIEYARSVLGERAFELVNIPPRKFLYFCPGNPIRLVNNSLD